MFNLQSGIHRRRFPAPLSPAQARKLKLQPSRPEGNHLSEVGTQTFEPGEGKHTRDVTGIVVDNLNQVVITCGLDGKVKFWNFATGLLLHQLDWSSMAANTGLKYHRSSDLAALSCDDLSIRVIDIETRKLVRELWGCVGQISDFCFSNDGRWVIAASMDSVIRVWDLPTGHLIDAIRIASACTALSFSTTGEFLATAHADSIGINVWSNRSLFANVSSRHVQEDEIAHSSLPSVSGEGGEALLEAAYQEAEPEEGSDDEGLPTSAMDQLSAGMTTLSLVPRSRWQTLLHLDTIAARNKPIEPPKAPEKAPFFLPSLESSKQMVLPPVKSPSDELAVSAAERSRISALQRNMADRPFTALLGASSGDPEPFIKHVKSLPPSAADIEIRSLNPLASPNELVLFVNALTRRLRRRQDYEVVQAWMAVFLKVHGEVIAEDASVKEALRDWRDAQNSEAKRLGSLAGYCSGVVAFLRSTR